jgi:hypothetical protein
MLPGGFFHSFTIRDKKGGDPSINATENKYNPGYNLQTMKSCSHGAKLGA